MARPTDPASLSKMSEKELLAALEELFDGGDFDALICSLDGLIAEDLGKKNAAVRGLLEREFLQKKLYFLTKYLFCLSARMGDDDFARFYLDQCTDEVKRDGRFLPLAEKYAPEERELPPFEYSRYHITREYECDGETCSYGVYSFSERIGQNMTLLKTRYGCVIFDCDAGTADGTPILISPSDFTRFLASHGAEVGDVVAVIVSHAHLDHYGSANSLVEAGIPPFRIFLGGETKRLLSAVAADAVPLGSAGSLAGFFVPDGKIAIEAFGNGHILGSEGYIVSFDGINVVYSGDYCLHGQRTVAGWDVEATSRRPRIEQNGVDLFITESTYGRRRRYLGYESAERVLKSLARRAISLGYRLFLPAFAIGKCQELALILGEEHSVLINGKAATVACEYEAALHRPIFGGNIRFGKEELLGPPTDDVVIASSGSLAEGSASAAYLNRLLQGGEKVAVITTAYADSAEDSYGARLLKQWQNRNNLLLDVPLAAHASYEEICTAISTLKPRAVVTVHGDGLLGLRQTRKEEETLELVLAEGDPVRRVMREAYGAGHPLLSERGFTTACRRLIVAARRAGYVEFADRLEYTLGEGLEIFLAYLDECVRRDFHCKFEKCPEVPEPLPEPEPAVFEPVKPAAPTGTAEGETPEMPVDPPSSDGTETFEELLSSDEKSPAPTTRRGVLSDIMIVKMGEDDYYVSEKISGRDVFRKLLLGREREANFRHLTFEQAQLKAMELRGRIRRLNPDCKIVTYDIADFPAEDNYYDCRGYERALLRKREEALSHGFDFYELGRAQGYAVASKCPKDPLEQEIKLLEARLDEMDETERVISSFEGETFDLYTDERKVVAGRLEAIKESVAVMETYRIKPTKWTVHLIDDIGESCVAALDGLERDVPGLGRYRVRYYGAGVPKDVEYTDTDVFIYFEKDSGAMDPAEIAWLDEHDILFHAATPTMQTLKKRTASYIESMFVARFRLTGAVQEKVMKQARPAGLNAGQTEEGTPSASQQLRISQAPVAITLARLYSVSPFPFTPKEFGNLKRLCRRASEENEKILFEHLGKPSLTTLTALDDDLDTLCRRINENVCTHRELCDFRDKYAKYLLALLVWLDPRGAAVPVDPVFAPIVASIAASLTTPAD